MFGLYVLNTKFFFESFLISSVVKNVDFSYLLLDFSFSLSLTFCFIKTPPNELFYLKLYTKKWIKKYYIFIYSGGDLNMIIDFIQTSRQPNCEYSIKDSQKNEEIAHCQAYSRHNPKIFFDSKIYALDFLGHSGQMTPIYENGLEAGSIDIGFVKTKQFLFIPIGYNYFRITLNQIELQAYECGLGEGEYYWNIFDRDKLIAMIHVSDVITNNKDSYKIYFHDKKYFKILCILTLYIDCIMSPDVGDINGFSYSRKGVYTIQKELLDKYDSKFIDSVKNEE